MSRRATKPLAAVLAGMGSAMAEVFKSDISGFRLQATDSRTFKIKRGP